MFIIFDSTNQIFDHLIQITKTPLTTKSFSVREHMRENFPCHHPLRYIGRRAIQSTDDRYPTYGIDIPNSCKDFPNRFLIGIGVCRFAKQFRSCDIRRITDVSSSEEISRSKVFS